MKSFKKAMQKQFDKMCQTGKLFKSTVPGNEILATYLNSFKEQKIFRDPNSFEHNCNHCTNFLRRYGNIISINKRGELESIFSNLGDQGEYTDSVEECEKLLTNSKIKDVFFETYESLKSLPYEQCNKGQDVYQLGVPQNHKKSPFNSAIPKPYLPTSLPK